MPTSQGTLKPFVTVNRSAELYNSVTYPVGGNVTTSTNAVFKASYAATSNVIYVTYMVSGQIVPGMAIAGIGIPFGAVILGPLNENGTGLGGLGSYTISLMTVSAQGVGVPPTGSPGNPTSNNPLTSAPTGQYGNPNTAGATLSGTASPSSYPQGPGGIVGPVPGFNCVNIMDLRDYYNLPYPPATPLASPPVIAVVSFGGGIYGQPVTTGQYAGFWKCTDISGNNGAPIQILVAPINGAINAPNADDGGATLENTVDVATVNAFYGMIDPRRDAPIYTPPVIILYIAPSSDISEMYRTFYTVLKNPVVCNGKSYSPTVVTCSWGAPEVAWTQMMPFPPNPSMPVDNSPNPSGVAELNEINDLFAEATKNGINICCASGDIPLTNINSSVNTYNYAQQLLLQGTGGNGYSGQTPQPQASMFPLTDKQRQSLGAPQVMFPSSSPYVTCVGGSSVYFPSINSGSYANPAEFAWDRANGGISSVFSIPAYQQQLPSAAAASAAQFLASSLNTANLSQAALGTPSPSVPFPDPISGGIIAPNTAVTLATQTKNDAYNSTLAAFNAAQAALQSAELSSSDDDLMNALVKTVKEASTALATAENNKKLADESLHAAQDLVVKTQTVSELLVNAGRVFGAAAASAGAAANTQALSLAAVFAAQQAAYTQLVTPNTANSIALQNANQAAQAAQAAAQTTSLAAVTLPSAVAPTTDVANDAVAQAAAAVVAPSLSSHPYLEAEPISSPLVPKSNGAYDTAQIVAGDLPYDSSASFAPSYLLTSLGVSYTINYADENGVDVSGNNNVRQHLNNAVTAADALVLELLNVPDAHLTLDASSNANLTTTYGQPSNIGNVAEITDYAIVDAVGQLTSNTINNVAYILPANQWRLRSNFAEMLPALGTGYTAQNFATRAIALAKSGATLISSYQSGAGIAAKTHGYNLPCGLASAAASCLAAVYTVTEDEKTADAEAGFPYGNTDTAGGMDASGSYNGITTGLINLRNIYANTTLAARRATTAHKAAHDAKEAFLLWSAAKDSVDLLQSQATTLYNLIPPPSNEQVRLMDEKLLAAKVALSSATYDLAVAENYAVTTARLAQQSAASTSLFMGNYIGTGTNNAATFDQLGNLNAVPSTLANTTEYQGRNQVNCPAIAFIDASGSTMAKNALDAAQSLIMAAANDNYLTTSITTWNTHGVTGVDTSGNQTVSLTGTRLLVQDAQYAAAGAAGQVANVAFSDATESVSRLNDWHNVALVAKNAIDAQARVYTAMNDASGNNPGTQAALSAAVDFITTTVRLIVSATTPYNQQSTPSATLATNNVVSLAAKLENIKNVCAAAQTAIQLAASTYSPSGSSNISGASNSIFTINMAYAKVTADAAAAACTAAAILAREEAVLAARRANYSAIALRKLVGEGVIGGAVAGFLDAAGNLVAQTGYGYSTLNGTPNAKPLPYSTGYAGVNGYKPPAVIAPTVLYQGVGGLSYDNDDLGNLQSSGNPQPNIITNLTYNGSQYTNVYSAVAGLTTASQAVLTALQSDSSGNSFQLADTNFELLDYPNVDARNAINTVLGQTGGAGLNAVHACLLSAYEAQQWVVASANASFVTFGYTPANVNLVNFTPSLLGVATKLASDADACLQTVLNAEGAILYALSLRPNKVNLHDLDASNFASAFNANQSAADTYLALMNAAVKHEKNCLIAFHMGDLTNALSPLAANAATAANQAAALGAMSFSNVPANNNYAANSAIAAASFPSGGWGSAGITGANIANINPGPYNGTSTGAAPFPAPFSSTSSRAQAPASQVLQVSSQLLNKHLSDAALETASAANDASESASAFNQLMVNVSTVTPSLVDAATAAAQNTLVAAKAANYATSLNNQGQLSMNLTNSLANLLIKNSSAVLAALESANANLEAITPQDARYLSRENMVRLWQIAADAAQDAVIACANAPTNYGDGTNPNDIVPASLGDPYLMGDTNDVSVLPNTAPIWDPLSPIADPVRYTANYSTPAAESVIQPSILSRLNAAVINAYNATTGAPDNTGKYRYIQFTVPGSDPAVLVTNIPENVNDTQQAYNNAVAALNANASVGNAPLSALVSAALAINAAHEAAQAAQANNASLPVKLPPGSTSTTGTFRNMQSASSMAVSFWNSALIFVNQLLANNLLVTEDNLATLMALVGINFVDITPSSATAQAISAANQANLIQDFIMGEWAKGPNGAYSYVSGEGVITWPGYVNENGVSIQINENLKYGISTGVYTDQDAVTRNYPSGSNTSRWSAYYFTKAIMDEGTVAYQTAYNAWQLVSSAYSSVMSDPLPLDANAANANNAKGKAVYSVKVALQAAARAGAAGQVSANATSALSTSTNSYEDLAADAAAQASYATTSNLNMYRCLPDIAMHANADDLPVIFRLNGGNVYVGGTAVAASMFAGFLGVVQSHSHINYFVNPVLYDNYTFPSPLFNDISGSSEVWYPGAVGGAVVPPRIANVLPGQRNPSSGLGSGLYNCNVGLGSIKAMNLAALMDIPHLVTDIHPNNGDSKSVSVYPGTSATLTAYVEPPSAYNPNLVWSCSSPNATVSQTNGPLLSNNGMNDTNPYTTYNPLQYDGSGNQLSPTLSIGNYGLGSVGNVAMGVNPYTNNPCLVFTATVTGVNAVAPSAPLPVVTVSSTDGSSVYGVYSIQVLPAIQVTGVSISAADEYENPANSILFLGKTLQLVANVTPLTATNQRVYWWSSNTSVVNVDASGLLTSLAPGQVTIKATSVNNNISASISVYVPTPITGINVLPTTITLNPNMMAYPLKNLGLIRAIVQPPEADYKHLSWEIVSSTQDQPAPAGITDVISLPHDGTVLARDSNGDITDNTESTVTALSNGSAVIRVSTYGEPYGVYGTYTTNVTVKVVTPVTDIVMANGDMVINLNPHTAQYDSNRSLPESYHITATLKPAYPSNMNVFWSSSNPKVAVVSNNSPAVLNTVTSDPNFGLWQITEKITPLSNGTTVIKVTTADGQLSDTTTVVVTTPVTGLSMSALPIILNPTKLYTLQATVLPTTATNRSLIWESTNTAIATVDSNGVVKAITSGSCGISATSVDGDYSAMSQVSVVTPLVGVQLMVNTPLPIHINDVVQILVVMVPTTATNQQFTWTVTDGLDGNIFTTGPPQNGNIVYLDAVQAGSSVFTVTSADGNKQASINLTVVQW